MRFKSSVLVWMVGILATAHAAPAKETLYSLRITGKARFLDNVSLNGKSVVGGTIVEVTKPLPVTGYLRNGKNTLEVEFTSDDSAGLTIALEERETGADKPRATRTLLTLPAAATAGNKVKRTVTFEAKVAAKPPDIALTAADRQALTAAVQSYYDLLAKPDSKAVEAIMQQAVSRAKERDADLAKTLGSFLLEETRKTLAHPRFRMKPASFAGLKFATTGEYAVVTRADGKPVFESDEIELDEGKGVKSKSKISATELSFVKVGDKWQFALRLP